MFLNLEKRTNYSTEYKFVYDRKITIIIIVLSVSFENTYKLQQQGWNSMHLRHQFYVLSNPVKLFINFLLHCNIHNWQQDACDRTGVYNHDLEVS